MPCILKPCGRSRTISARSRAAMRRHDPRYPDALFAWLAMVAPGQTLAWDCGAGSGRRPVALAGYFDARGCDRRECGATGRGRAAPTHHVPGCVRLGIGPRRRRRRHRLRRASLALVSAGRVLPEVRRAAEASRRCWRPGRTPPSCWTTPRPTPSCVPTTTATVDAYWPPERRHVENGYRDMPFPFTRIDVPAFHMRTSWTLDQVTDVPAQLVGDGALSSPRMYAIRSSTWSSSSCRVAATRISRSTSIGHWHGDRPATCEAYSLRLQATGSAVSVVSAFAFGDAPTQRHAPGARLSTFSVRRSAFFLISRQPSSRRAISFSNPRSVGR